MKKQEKVFVVRKYVWARDAEEAIKKSKRQGVDDCWSEDDVQKQLLKAQMEKQIEIGFKTNNK